MKCNEARELFSPWIDKEIDKAEQEVLLNHVESCPDCRQELAEMERISALLRECLAETAAVPAPPELAATVMGVLQAEAKPKRLVSWKKAAAGIAAALALYLGSSGLLLAPLGQMAEKEPVVKAPLRQNTEQPGKASPLGNISNNLLTNPGDKLGQVTIPYPAKDSQGSITPDDPARAALKDNPEIALADKKETREDPVFLSKERLAVSTLLKLQVAEALKAQEQTLGLAEASGATLQSLGQQMDGNRECLVLKITVPAEKAASLKGSLAALGSEISRQEDKKDLSGRFSESLEQYRVLSDRAAGLQDEGQIKEIEAQMKALEKELSGWDKEAAYETIVLWLES